MNALVVSKAAADPASANRPKALANLPPFPAIARKLLAAVSRESVTIPEITRLIKSDAAFTGEVLRLANSAIIGLRYEVVSILHAVSVLGMDRLKALVLTVGMRDFLQNARHAPFLKQCWRHQLASALIGEWLAEPCWLDSAACYTAGLLHDVGKLALGSIYPSQYDEVLRRARASGEDLRQLEQEAMGIDHREASRTIADEWALPRQLRKVLCLEESTGGDEAFTDATLILLSCHIADRMGFQIAGEDAEWDVSLLEEGLPPEAWSAVSPKVRELREAVPYKINLFECEFLNH